MDKHFRIPLNLARRIRNFITNNFIKPNNKQSCFNGELYPIFLLGLETSTTLHVHQSKVTKPNNAFYLAKEESNFDLTDIKEITLDNDNLEDKSFNYCIGSGKGPDSWAKSFSKYCGGSCQSPINIPKLENTVVQKKTPNLKWHGYDTIPVSMNLTNTGETIKLTTNWPDNRSPTVSGGVLTHTYRFENLHFHWGQSDHIGSEHSMDGKFYPIEMHAVHVREDCGSVTDAMSQKDGLLVVAFFGEITTSPCSAGLANKEMIEAVSKLEEHKTVLMPPVALDNFVVPNENGYISYEGSLTTPNCNEAVTWIVNLKPFCISIELMAKFREVSKANKCMTNNFRPVQPLNGRKIYYVPYSK